jgi:hypothetical protein
MQLLHHPTSLTIRVVAFEGSPSALQSASFLNLLLVVLSPVKVTRLATNIVQVAVVVPVPLYCSS